MRSAFKWAPWALSACLVVAGCASKADATDEDPKAESSDDDDSDGSDDDDDDDDDTPRGRGDGGTKDASVEADPSKACDDLPDARNLCEFVVGAAPDVIGGVPPDGVYDRTGISAIVEQHEDCGSAEVRLKGGLYTLVFHELGGPFVSGGSYTVDSSDNLLHFDGVCGNDKDAFDEIEYSWKPANKTLTLFYRGTTAWTYTLRK